MSRNPALLRPWSPRSSPQLVTAGRALPLNTSWKQGRTPDGQPDLQGIWLNFDSTPFEAAAPSRRLLRPQAARRRPTSDPRRSSPITITKSASGVERW
jgi:hypothetical protein